MADLVYYSQCSLDGLIADEGGDFSWAFPPDDVHRAANDVAARTGVHLLGRRTYEVMRYWDEERDGVPEVEAEFQRAWASSAKVVYSRSIDEVGPNARIERSSTLRRRERSPMQPTPRWGSAVPTSAVKRCEPASWMFSRSYSSR